MKKSFFFTTGCSSRKVITRLWFWESFLDKQRFRKTITFSETKNSRFVNFEIPTGVYQKVDCQRKAHDLVKVNFVTDDVTMKAVKLQLIFWNWKKPFFVILSSSTPNEIICPMKLWKTSVKKLNTYGQENRLFQKAIAIMVLLIGMWRFVLFTLSLGEIPGYKHFCEQKTKDYTKIKEVCSEKFYFTRSG